MRRTYLYIIIITISILFIFGIGSSYMLTTTKDGNVDFSIWNAAWRPLGYILFLAYVFLINWPVFFSIVASFSATFLSNYFPTRWVKYVTAPLFSVMLFIVSTAVYLKIMENNLSDFARVTEGLGIALFLGPILLVAFPLSFVLPLILVWKREKKQQIKI